MLAHFLTICKRQRENERQGQGGDETVLCEDLRGLGAVAVALVKPLVLFWVHFLTSQKRIWGMVDRVHSACPIKANYQVLLSFPSFFKAFSSAGDPKRGF